MLNINDHLPLTLLKETLQCCQDIQELLKNDKNHFMNNELNLIETSNIKKAELLEKLNFLTANLNAHDQQMASLEKAQEKTGQVVSVSQQELTSLTEKLKIEITACYKAIVTNSTIVFSNLQQLKEIWDKLLSYHSSNHCVYDDKGSIK